MTVMLASSAVNEIGASVAPGKNHYSRVRVDGANVLTNSSKANVLTDSSKWTKKHAPDVCRVKVEPLWCGRSSECANWQWENNQKGSSSMPPPESATASSGVKKSSDGVWRQRPNQKENVADSFNKISGNHTGNGAAQFFAAQLTSSRAASPKCCDANVLGVQTCMDQVWSKLVTTNLVSFNSVFLF